MAEQIVQHGLRCRGCGEDIYSNFRHDFVTCKCGATFIDGGFAYQRAGWDEKVGPGEAIERTLTAYPDRRFRGE